MKRPIMIVLSIDELLVPPHIRDTLKNLKRLSFDQPRQDYRIGNASLESNGINVKALHWLINQPVCSMSKKNAGMQDVKLSVFNDLRQTDLETMLRLNFQLTD